MCSCDDDYEYDYPSGLDYKDRDEAYSLLAILKPHFPRSEVLGGDNRNHIVWIDLPDGRTLTIESWNVQKITPWQGGA